MENPFLRIDSRLSNIESLLLQLKHKSEEPKEEQNLTVEEVAGILKVSKQSVYSYIKRGELKASKVGRNLLISRSNLDEALTETKSLKYRRSQ